MSEYIKQNFISGQILKAEHLNHIENGIESNAIAVASLAGKIADKQPTGDYASAIYTIAYGNPLSVNDATERAVKELTVTLQSDTGFDSVNVRVSGKNLFNKAQYTNAVLGKPNCSFLFPVSLYGEFRAVYMPIDPGETYTITQTEFGNYARWGVIDEVHEDYAQAPVYQPPMQTSTDDIEGYVTLSSSETNRTFVNKFNHKYLIGLIWDKDDTIAYDKIADSIQVEFGTSATEVVLYNGGSYTISIGENVTEGTLDVVGGTFTKADGVVITTEKVGIMFANGYNVVTANNATNIYSMYAVDTKKYIDMASGAAADNPLYGKKIVAIGDSMVYGHNLPSDQTWLARIAQRNNMTYVNYGRNGSYMTHNPREANNQTDWYDSVYDRYVLMDNDADYVLVFSGTNDIQQNFTIGNEDSSNAAEFYGALNAITDGLQAKYPTAKIAFITPYARAGLKELSKKYSDAICTACERGGIPVFDNIRDGGINWDIDAQLTAYTLGDNCHLNAAGMEMASRKYENFLKQI